MGVIFMDVSKKQAATGGVLLSCEFCEISKNTLQNTFGRLLLKSISGKNIETKIKINLEMSFMILPKWVIKNT